VRRLCRHRGYATAPRQGATDFQLSLGKIVDTLRADYGEWFERTPNFDIFDEHIVCEMDLMGRQLSQLNGKRAYCRLLTTLQRATAMTVREGQVKCSVHPWSACDGTLRVNWTCTGQLGYQPLHISAISAYAVASEASSSERLPYHLIDRHKIDFLEIHPPSLKTFLRGIGWQPQSSWQPREEPALALNRFQSLAEVQAVVSEPRPFEAEACKA